MATQPVLSRRGVHIKSFDRRGLFGNVLLNPYDPDTNPDGFCNLGVAENFAMIPEVRDFVSTHLDLKSLDFTYGEGPWGVERLRKAFARHMTKHFKALNPVDSDDLIVTNGVTALVNILGFILGDPDDAFLIGTPVYQAFEPDFGIEAQLKPLFVPLDDIDPTSAAAVAQYQQALEHAAKDGPRVCAMVLCNPHNPLGVCYPKETIIALMQLCQKHRVHLLVDEIYATSVFDVPDKDAVPFISVLSFDTTPYIDHNLLHVIYGMSKDFGSGGLRVGLLQSRSKEVIAAAGAITQFHWSGLPSQQIAATILEDQDWVDGYILRAKQKLAAHNTLCKTILDAKGIKYHTGGNAGFFLWLDLSPWLSTTGSNGGGDDDAGWQAEADLGQRFVENGVFLTDGKGLHASRPGRFRLIFSQNEASLREGLRRMFAVLGI